MYGYGYQYGKILSGGGLPFTPPLDVYTGAAAAYSLRLLRSAYTGSAIRVRRSSDSAESDIGFVSGVLDTATLLTFCGAGDGFVTKWYDQSGNAKHLLQTTESNQPQIVSVGSLITSGSKVAMVMDGVNDAMSVASITSATSRTVIMSAEDLGTTTFRYFYDGPTNAGAMLGTSSNEDTYRFSSGGTGNFSDLSGTYADPIKILTFIQHQVNSNAYINGTLRGISTKAAPGSGIFALGASNLLGGNANMKFQEVILYTTDQTSNRNGIETNLNSYYAIY